MCKIDCGNTGIYIKIQTCIDNLQFEIRLFTVILLVFIFVFTAGLRS